MCAAVTYAYNSLYTSHHQMDTTQQDNISLSSPAQSLASSSALTISPSSYLTVPNPRSLRSPLSLPRRIAFEEDDSKVHITSDLSPASEPLPQILVLSRSNTPTGSSTSTSPRSRSKILSDRLYMSVHSTSSTDTDTSEYSNPPARPYRIPSFQRMSGSRKISAVRSPAPSDLLRSMKMLNIFRQKSNSTSVHCKHTKSIP